MAVWKELKVTPEEEKMAQDIRNQGVGKSLPLEVLNQFQVAREWDMEIDTAVGKTLVHMYLPVETEEKLPLLINMHGGGFIKGRRDQDIVFCRNISSRSRTAVADIDYVIAPDMRYPGQVMACYDVLQYFGTHAEEMGFDVSRIALGGHSAGGTLTAACILMAIDRGGFIPALQILDYPGLDMKTPVRQKRNGETNPRIPAWKAEFYTKMYVDPEEAGEVYCSPILAADAQLAQMPPTLLMYCENDSFCDEAAQFNSRLLAAGVPVYAKRFMNSSHGFLVQRKGEYQVGEAMLLTALERMM